MAANDIGNFVSVEAPEGFKNYDNDGKIFFEGEVEFVINK